MIRFLIRPFLLMLKTKNKKKQATLGSKGLILLPLNGNTYMANPFFTFPFPFETHALTAYAASSNETK